MNQRYNSDIAFTPAVKAEQEKRGSRHGYQRQAEKRDWRNEVTEDLKSFLETRNSFYLATSTKDGQPYIQHRGGPRGFLKVLGKTTLGFADFAGNRQYISIGNASENDKAHIFLMDYENQQRVKLWGRLTIVEDDDELLRKLTVQGYGGRVQRAFLFELKAWDSNCPQHIPQKFDSETVEITTAKLVNRIKELEAEIAGLKEK